MDEQINDRYIDIDSDSDPVPIGHCGLEMVQQAMRLNFKILLEPLIKNQSICLSPSNEIKKSNLDFQKIDLKDDSARLVMFELELDYFSLPDSLNLFSFDGFVPGLNQKITIKDIVINGQGFPEDFFNFLNFSVKKNKFVSDYDIKNCFEICFNGDLSLSLTKNKSRIFWCPYYFSDKKDDFVFRNWYLDDYESDTIPYDGGPGTAKKNYMNEPHHYYDKNLKYSFACFGCSVTRGTGLTNKQIWTNLIDKNNINLAVAGLGFDGIFLNLKNAMKKFQFDKVVILLPNFERRLVRIKFPKMNAYCRITVNTNTLDWHHSRLKHWAWQNIGIWCDNEQLEKWKKIYKKKAVDMVMGFKDNAFSKRVLDRILRLLKQSDKQFYLSSWDEEVYNYLVNMGSIADNVLPFFKKIDYAIDNCHPGPLSHAGWVNIIKEKIINRVRES